MPDIVSLGEMVVDFTRFNTEAGEEAYIRSAGGSPANVACTAAKLGASAGFIGKLGRDTFGFYLKDTLTGCGVDISGLVIDPKFTTPIAFVGKNEDGGRDYVFYRSALTSADINLRYGEVNRSLIENCRIFHFGSLSLTDEPSRTAAVNSAEYAKSLGKIVSYDPNWRPGMWISKEVALREMRRALKYADIIRVSEDELGMLADCGTLVAAAAKLLGEGVKILCITQGAKGCVIATSKGIEQYSAPDVPIVDTLGSADCFLGGFLYSLVKTEKELSELDSEDIEKTAVFASVCGALSASKKGAVPSVPSLDEVRAMLKEK